MIHAVAALLLSCSPAARAPSESGSTKTKTREIRAESAALDGTSRPLELHGRAPERRRSPLVLVAPASDAPPERAEQWCEALASRGFAALVVDRIEDETWWRYAAALEAAAGLLRMQVADAEAPLFDALAADRPLLLAEGDATNAAARAAAALPSLAGLLLVDPREAGLALPWLDRVTAPIATVASGAPHAEPAGAWYQASRGGDATRFLVEFRGEAPLPTRDSAARPLLEREVRDLCVTFADCLWPTPGSRDRSFEQRARRGAIDRVVRWSDQGARLALVDSR